MIEDQRTTSTLSTQNHAALQSTRRQRSLGDYTLGRTLGVGSTAKVVLAQHNVTGEKLAIKIIPRAKSAQLQPPHSIDEHASTENPKEIRAIREAALCMLLHHPHICSMREMIVHQHHYYLVLEYVSGGQLLDYVISHGRLREKVARKFARQIGSALEYCHKNNVVHRNLKIENILISQTGNIKITDFCVANLWDPNSHLSTACGSNYFPAPELLNACIYTGPEVDVWSFGVALYVLVCGRVPFDDRSMPALHAKIKRGQVEYPVWLSAVTDLLVQDCLQLLSRMLATDPATRATLQEVLNHPWMLRGFDDPPSHHLHLRKPLRPVFPDQPSNASSPLDKNTISRMGGFGFGSYSEIEDKLLDILKNESYRKDVEAWERREDTPDGVPTSTHTRASQMLCKQTSTLGTSSLGSKSIFDGAGRSSVLHKVSRSLSSLGYLKKKLFRLNSPSQPVMTGTAGFVCSEPGLDNIKDKEYPNPTQGYHPLLSIYFLAREKMEREKVDTKLIPPCT
ncbi:serine/threonine-protein kinase KIN2 [Tulasnella sp. UAMH 9824]|nr:serine/threonine-protein kinase KIN2 [Tulasnella sp. UAMH 9824]